MELVFLTHRSLAHIHYLAPITTWLLLIGAAYGAIRLIVDLGRVTRLWRLLRKIPL